MEKNVPCVAIKLLIKKLMQVHFMRVHGINIETKGMCFTSYKEFLTWKTEFEHKSKSKFIKKNTVQHKNYFTYMFICHRSGMYKGIGERHLKIQASNKINAYCPAYIKLTYFLVSETYKIEYVDKHVGHGYHLGHMFLTRAERRNVAKKIAAKIPFDEILNEIQDSGPNSNLETISLLMRKDLYNVEDLSNFLSVAIKCDNGDLTNESWVNHLKQKDDCILFFKPQGVIIESHPELSWKDFVIVIMTVAQSDFLIKYGPNVVCFDEIHGLDGTDFKVTVVLVMDELGEGFPCGILISNRADQEVLSLFIRQIKKKTDTITPRIFMSDVSNSLFNAWINIMGIPEKRLLCAWHIDCDWRANIQDKITDKVLQVAIYKKCRTLLDERDITSFEVMLQAFLNSSEYEAADFIEYFKNNYVANAQCWAFCHRLNTDINTSMHFERLHKTIKYIYLESKGFKNLDKAICTVIGFICDKLFGMLVTQHKSKICSKIKAIRQNHKNTTQVGPMLVVPNENDWEVQSENSHEVYLVEEVNTTCKCQLNCIKCDVCIHRYSCSCAEASIKFNMCVHIHLIATLNKTDDVPEEDQTFTSVRDEENDDCLHINNSEDSNE